MAKLQIHLNFTTTASTFFFMLSIYAPLSTSTSHHQLRNTCDDQTHTRKFEIAHDMFWKDGKPFRIIGGDLHYFRVLPEYWEDRLLRAKALGLNAIQTYVPWNLHEPRQGQLVFEGIADIVAFLKLCQKLDFVVLLRPGPYICGEWDLGGFPAWLLSIEPAVRLRSSDPAFLKLVEKWWGILLPKMAPLLYSNGGPIIMVQIENEFGSYGDDKPYLHHLVKLARSHLGEDLTLYTTDGGSRETLQKGTIRGDTVYSAVDFTTGDDPWPIFKLQKEFNAPGKSPPLSAEFYTGWLTHWGENIARTDAKSTAAALEKILEKNGSAVLYMAHGGTNFGFYNGANTGGGESDYEPDLTSYDYDAPITEFGDVDNAKFKALRKVIEQYSAVSLPPLPRNNKKTGYGNFRLQRTAFLFDILDKIDHADILESDDPVSMEVFGEMFGLVLYASEYIHKGKKDILSIPKVHDRAQVFVSCPPKNKRPKYAGTIERWSNQAISLPNLNCSSPIKLLILVENMGRVNYGPYMFDRKGILSSVYLNGEPVYKWKMLSVPFQRIPEIQKINATFQSAPSANNKKSSHKKPIINLDSFLEEPAFYVGSFDVGEVHDSFISFTGWRKGIAFVNGFNIGRFWPSMGPQCNLYVPAPVLHHGKNVVVILELESPNPDLALSSVDHPDFTCGSSSSKVHQL